MRRRRDTSRLLSVLRDSLVDLEVTIERMSVANGHILTWSRIRGVNHRGVPELGIPANGLRLDLPCVTVDGLQEGFAIHWDALDLAEVYRQLAPSDLGVASGT